MKAAQRLQAGLGRTGNNKDTPKCLKIRTGQTVTFSRDLTIRPETKE
jgi:hypothetical protein